MATFTRHPRVEALGLEGLASSSDEELSIYAAIMDDLTAMARRRYNAAVSPADQEALEAGEQLRAYGIGRVAVDLELTLRRQHRATLNGTVNETEPADPLAPVVALQELAETDHAHYLSEELEHLEAGACFRCGVAVEWNPKAGRWLRAPLRLALDQPAQGAGDGYCPTCGYLNALHGPAGCAPDELEARAAYGDR